MTRAVQSAEIGIRRRDAPASAPAVTGSEVSGSSSLLPTSPALSTSPTASLPEPSPYPPLPPAPGYALSARLDPGPRPLDDIIPDYPENAHSRTGSVVVRILVAANGTLDDVAVADATPPGLFDRAAVEAVRRTRFAPGQLLGLPVKSQITVEIGFAEINRGAAVSGRGY